MVVLGHRADEIASRIGTAGVDIIINPLFAEGISSSIKEGIAALRADVAAALMVIGDQPLLRPETIDRLLEAYEVSVAKAILPTFQGKRGNPAFLDLSLRPYVEALEGDMDCRQILEELEEVLTLEVDDPGVLVDVDTQGDLDRALEDYRHGGRSCG